MNIRRLGSTGLSFAILAFCTQTVAELKDLEVAQDYTAEIFASDVESARSLAVGKEGTLFVGSKGSKVFAFKNGQRYTVAKDLNTPTGVAFKDGSLYIAEVSRILRLDKIEANLANPPALAVVYDKLPNETHHGMKFIRFGPDGMLYVPVGAPCNVCNKEEKDARFATILRFKSLKGTDPEIFAKGIRNTVGFDWHPKTKALWFTENGRDNMGDDIPADELNVATKPGMHFGFPYCHQGDLVDKEFGAGKSCGEFTAPTFPLGAHVAALGMRFVNDTTVVVALHGSWNRSAKVGYQLVRLTLKGAKVEKAEPLVSGFLKGSNRVLGRPVDVEILPDKSIVFTDDDEDTIYRLVPKNLKVTNK